MLLDLAHAAVLAELALRLHVAVDVEAVDAERGGGRLQLHHVDLAAAVCRPLAQRPRDVLRQQDVRAVDLGCKEGRG